MTVERHRQAGYARPDHGRRARHSCPRSRRPPRPAAHAAARRRRRRHGRLRTGRISARTRHPAPRHQAAGKGAAARIRLDRAACRRRPESLRRIPGMGDTAVAALKIVQATSLRMLKGEFRDKPLLASWDALLDWLRADMGPIDVERVRVLYLNSRNMLIRDELVSEGDRKSVV